MIDLILKLNLLLEFFLFVFACVEKFKYSTFYTLFAFQRFLIDQAHIS